MTCIKTGARVFLENLGCVLAADLYEVGDCIVIRSNPKAMENANRLPGAAYTHSVWLTGKEFFRVDIGVIVVPAGQVSAVKQGEPG